MTTPLQRSKATGPRVRAAIEIRDAMLSLLATYGRMERISGLQGAAQTAAVRDLHVIHRTPFQRLPPLAGPTKHALAVLEQQTGRELRNLPYGLDIAEPCGKVLNIEWTEDDDRVELVRFDRGLWEDVVLLEAATLKGCAIKSQWSDRLARLDELCAAGAAARIPELSFNGERALSTVAARHRNHTICLSASKVLPPRAIARVNRALKARPTDRLLWWSQSHDALGGNAVASLVAWGTLEPVLRLARVFPTRMGPTDDHRMTYE